MNAPPLSFLQIDPAELSIQHEATVNPQNGAANMAVRIPMTAGRSGFQPSLTLAYQSGAGNSAFGLGWNLQGTPSISLSLKDGYPKYDGRDKFAFGGQELKPWLEPADGAWRHRKAESSNFLIYYYRISGDASLSRFEKWVDKRTRDIHWRTHNRDNQVLVFGKDDTGATKIYDLHQPAKIFEWLPEEQYDNQGNAVRYVYKAENLTNVDGSTSYERNRVYGQRGNARKYLKSIRYGNTLPAFPGESTPPAQHWLFEVVFDYGDQKATALPYYSLTSEGWPARPDPFSSYQAGFEQRTYRLCRRILMFHHIGELGPGPTLVGSTAFTYLPDPAATTLSAIHYTGFRRLGVEAYEPKSLPPLLFNYASARMETVFRPAPEQTTDNVPIGLNALQYKWVDLYGEGLPGVLYESNAAWYYKPNLGGGRLGKQEKVAEKPSAGFGTYALSDFDRDGNPNLVVLQGRGAGFYEYDRDRASWDGFRPFRASPQVRQMDANTQLIDLTGDGRADIVTTEADRIIWFPSKGKEGFGKALQLAKPVSNGVSRTPMIGSRPMLDYFFADMNGSGLPDQVRIGNGRVEYWPNLGHGRFGAGIVMEDAPLLDFGFELNADRIRLTDLDGSGTADLLYIGRGEIKYWINASGNKFIPGGTLRGLPYIDNVSSVQVIDFLGDGTPCLVWSSALPMHAEAPIHYLRLTGGMKPRLLLSVQNSTGLETRFHYGYSGRHYLRDKYTDQAWITKMPAHQTVVDRLEKVDTIANTSFNQLYEYHDGFFDGAERAFRGFGLVDQYDSDIYEGTSEEAFSDPVCVRTWYHNGAPGWQKARMRHYYSQDTYSTQLRDLYLEEGSDLGPEEFFPAVRSLAGQVIRSETYGLTAGKRSPHPFAVQHHNYLIRKLQSGRDEHDPCFAVFRRESLEIVFEELPDDPRIKHQFNLKIDRAGIPELQASVAYPRWHPEALPEQQAIHIHAGRLYAGHFDTQDRYQLGIELEKQSFELQDPLTPPAGTLYSFGRMRDLLHGTIDVPLAFDQAFTEDEQQGRLLQWSRHYFWNDEQSAVLPWGSVGDKVLLHHPETACFHDRFLEQQLGEHYDPALPEAGHYTQHDELWWQAGPVIHYHDDTGFYFPAAKVRKDGGRQEYHFDDHYLALKSVTAVLTEASATGPVRNRTAARIDYHLLAPDQIVDINGNISEVLYDPLGVSIRTSIHGEILTESGALESYGHSPLEQYVLPSDPDFGRILEAPSAYLQECASCFYYEWQGAGLPLRTIGLIREDWVRDGAGNYRPDSEYQVQINYHDGFGRVIQTKTRVEGGPETLRYEAGALVTRPDGSPEYFTSDVPRWHSSGHVVYNNKQQPIRQYEPYFSPLPELEREETLLSLGHSTLLKYDALGRQTAVHFADGTLNLTQYGPWQTREFDANDAVLLGDYAANIEENYAPESPEYRALQQSIAHSDTPVSSHIDGLGRVFLTEESDNEGNIRRNKVVLDALGNPMQMINAREIERVIAADSPGARALPAFAYRRDMQGRIFYEDSVDAGEKRQFLNALDQPTHLWEALGVQQQIIYDSWGRVQEKYVQQAPDIKHRTEHFVYGEAVADAKQKNLHGQLVEHYDQAGRTRFHRYDLLGNILEKDRRLLANYRSIRDWSHPEAVGWASGAPFRSATQYDALGRPVAQQLPDATTRKFVYLRSGPLDQLLVSTVDGRLVDQPIIKNSVYNARGQKNSVLLGNEVRQAFTYDPVNYRLIRKSTTHTTGEDTHPTIRSYQNIHYTYDAVGNLTQLVDMAQARPDSLFDQERINRYTYDAFYQLTRAEGRTHQALQRADYAAAPDGSFIKGTRHINLNDPASLRAYTRTYAYDLNGNMKKMVHRTAGAPEDRVVWHRDFWISERSNRSLEALDHRGHRVLNPEDHFDKNGNLIQLSHLRAVQWNYLNQLTRAVIIDRGAESDADYYVYGGDGQRVRKVQHRWAHGTLEITEKIYLDGCEISRILTGGAAVPEQYISHFHDGGERVAIMYRRSGELPGDATDARMKPSILYQLNDHLGSSALELSVNGEIITYEEYFPFGGSAFIAGDNDIDVRRKVYRYSGKERDDGTGLYYYGFRYYAPWMHRWLNPDPIGPEDGLNLYGFVGNDPVNNEDKNGLQSYFRMPSREDLQSSADLFFETAESLLPESLHEQLRRLRAPTREGIDVGSSALGELTGTLAGGTALASTGANPEEISEMLQHGVDNFVNEAREINRPFEQLVPQATQEESSAGENTLNIIDYLNPFSDHEFDELINELATQQQGSEANSSETQVIEPAYPELTKPAYPHLAPPTLLENFGRFLFGASAIQIPPAIEGFQENPLLSTAALNFPGLSGPGTIYPSIPIGRDIVIGYRAAERGDMARAAQHFEIAAASLIIELAGAKLDLGALNRGTQGGVSIQAENSLQADMSLTSPSSSPSSVGQGPRSAMNPETMARHIESPGGELSSQLREFPNELAETSPSRPDIVGMDQSSSRSEIGLDGNRNSTSPETQIRRLPIVNPHFMPEDLHSVLTNQVQAVIADENRNLAKKPRLAMEVMSAAEVMGMVNKAGFIGGFRQAYGHVIERLVGRRIMADPFLSQFLEYIPNIEQMRRGGSPDIIGIGLVRGLEIDITTPQQALSKMKKGIGYRFVLYERLFGPWGLEE